MVQSMAFPTINMVATGANITRLRKARGISVRELQRFFGFDNPQAIYKWQWGSSLPSVDNLFALSRILEVPIQDILVGDDQDVVMYAVWWLMQLLTGSLPDMEGRREALYE